MWILICLSKAEKLPFIHKRNLLIFVVWGRDYFTQDDFFPYLYPFSCKFHNFQFLSADLWLTIKTLPYIFLGETLSINVTLFFLYCINKTSVNAIILFHEIFNSVCWEQTLFSGPGYVKQPFAESLSGDSGFLPAAYPTHQPIFRALSLERFPPYYLQSDLQILPSLMVQDSKLCLWHIVRRYWAFLPRVTQWKVTVGRLDPHFTLSALLPFLSVQCFEMFSLYIFFGFSFNAVI